MNNKGFTLIEISVATGIVLVLISTYLFYFLNFSEYIKSSRDARRISDLEKLYKNLEANLTLGTITLVATKSTDNKRLIFNSSLSSLSPSGDGYVPFISSVKDFRLLSELPRDPLNNKNINNSGTKHSYLYCSDGTRFKLATKFESQEFQKKMNSDGGESPDWYEIGSNLSLCDF
jgi:prepilin-type N-terminal cleavage/methylation domain-containing protein